jgi:hypothetical protein
MLCAILVAIQMLLWYVMMSCNSIKLFVCGVSATFELLFSFLMQWHNSLPVWWEKTYHFEMAFFGFFLVPSTPSSPHLALASSFFFVSYGFFWHRLTIVWYMLIQSICPCRMNKNPAAVLLSGLAVAIPSRYKWIGWWLTCLVLMLTIMHYLFYTCQWCSLLPDPLYI